MNEKYEFYERINGSETSILSKQLLHFVLAPDIKDFFFWGEEGFLWSFLNCDGLVVTDALICVAFILLVCESYT